MTAHLRHAGAGDAESIAQLHAESWKSAYRDFLRPEFLEREAFANRQALWRGRLEAPRKDQLVLVATEGERLVGFVCAVGSESAKWGSLIDNLHVAPALTRSGIGVALMQRAGEWLAEHHPRAGVYLWVIERNVIARRFYEKLGGRLVETEDHTFPDGGVLPTCRYAWDHPLSLHRAIVR